MKIVSRNGDRINAVHEGMIFSFGMKAILNPEIEDIGIYIDKDFNPFNATRGSVYSELLLERLRERGIDV